MNDMFLSTNNLADAMVMLEKIYVEFDGHMESDVSQVKVYQDVDDDGLVDIPGDIELGRSPFAGGVAGINVEPDLPVFLSMIY